MSLDQELSKAFKQSTIIAGHGKRNVETLLKAFQAVDGNLESDLYGKGKIIEDFQTKIASFLGKEAAVFFPSGTMAQQIALRIWADQKGVHKVAYHPLSHLEIHEEDGLKKLHHIDAVLLANKDRVIEFEDVVGMTEEVSSILLELPQREIGGQLPSFETLEKVSAYCKENDIKLHLDGARLLEILSYYQKTAAEVCELFDSVYMSFYKGIGGIAGAILAGPEPFIEESKIWKRRHGGDLISLYPYIIPADYYFDQRVEKMDKYWQEAQKLARYFNDCSGVTTRPVEPVSNMFHVHFRFPKEKVVPLLIDIYQETGIGITGHLREVSEFECYFEVSIGDQYEVVQDKLPDVFKLLKLKLQGLE